jgi:hypothetical protein
LANNGRLCAATRTSSLPASHMTSDSTQLSAGMTATLSAELEGRAARDLVADVARAVLGQSRPGSGG